MPSNLPTLEKNWEFLNNIPVLSTAGVSLTSFRILVHAIIGIMTDQVPGAHKFSTGSIQNPGGTTFAVNPGDTSFGPSIIGNVVGKKVRIRGATTSANNGDFTITAQLDTGGVVYRLHYVNASGVAETCSGVACSYEVIGRRPFTHPWVVHHAGLASGIHINGTPGDGINPFDAATDFTMANGNHAYVVLKNPITGTEWLIDGRSESSSQEGNWAYIRFTGGPFSFDARSGAANVLSTATPSGSRPDGQTFTTAYNSFYGGGSQWFNGRSEAGTIFHCVLSLQISTDGRHTRLLMAQEGVFPGFMFDEQVRNPIGMGSYTNVYGYVASQSDSGHAMEYSRLNDSTFVAVPRLLNATLNLNYDIVTEYITTEGYI